MLYMPNLSNVKTPLKISPGSKLYFQPLLRSNFTLLGNNLSYLTASTAKIPLSRNWLDTIPLINEL